MSAVPSPDRPETTAHSAPTILIVLVRYRTSLSASPTVRTLGAALSASARLQQCTAVLVWDNSPEPESTDALPFACEYRHSGENVGVSGAYNAAMELAEGRRIPWLLLLDQDSDLPLTLPEAMLGYAVRLEAEERIAMVAPTVLMDGVPVSPKIMSRFGVATDPAPGAVGPTASELIVMNSGMLLRVAALRDIGGYSMDFWLDFSDRYMCHMLWRRGFHAFLAGDVQMEHNVSLVAGTQSLARYAILMGAQDAYFAQFKSWPRNVVFCVRLLRGAWQTRRSDPERSRLMWQHLRRRFTQTKRRRLAEWRVAAAAQRRGTVTS